MKRIYIILLLTFSITNIYAQDEVRVEKPSEYVDVRNYVNYCNLGSAMIEMVAIRWGGSFHSGWNIIPRKNYDAFVKDLNQLCESRRKAEREEAERKKREARNREIQEHNRKVAEHNAKVQAEAEERARKKAEEKQQAEIKWRTDNIVAPAAKNIDNMAKSAQGFIGAQGAEYDNVKKSDELKKRAEDNKGNPNVPSTQIDPALRNIPEQKIGINDEPQ